MVARLFIGGGHRDLNPVVFAGKAGSHFDAGDTEFFNVEIGEEHAGQGHGYFREDKKINQIILRGDRHHQLNQSEQAKRHAESGGKNISFA